MKVRIYKPHTHAGVALTPGADGIDIEVTAPEADFLRAKGLLQPPPGKPSVRAQRAPINASPEVASGNDPDKTPAETKRTST